MKGSWKWVSGVVLTAVIAFAMIAPELQAGLGATGKFKLPFDAQVGKVALPTGNYSFTVKGSQRAEGSSSIKDRQAVGTLLPQTFDGYESKSEKPVLVCIRHDGNVTVRALRLPGVGTFYFSLPKELKTLVAQQPQLIETISIEANGK